MFKCSDIMLPSTQCEELKALFKKINCLKKEKKLLTLTFFGILMFLFFNIFENHVFNFIGGSILLFIMVRLITIYNNYSLLMLKLTELRNEISKIEEQEALKTIDLTLIHQKSLFQCSKIINKE